jgi:hypothetical protein
MSASFSVIAERFRRAGQLDRAVALCQEGLAEFPDHLSARVTLGCALLDQGQYLDAHRELQIVIKRAPDNLAAIRGLAELHSRGFGEEEAPELTDETEIESPLSLEVPEAEAAEEFDPPLELISAWPPTGDVEPTAALEVPAAIDEVPIGMLASPVTFKAVPEPDAPATFEAFDTITALEQIDRLDTMNTFDTTEIVELAPMPFEIEDVIGDAGDVAGRDMDGFADDLDGLFDPDVVAMPAGEAGVHVQTPVPLERPTDPLPVPELSSGPIAVLDEWLTRIRARRSELLSEYAAGLKPAV